MYNTKQKLIFSTLAAFFTATTLCAGEVTIPNTFTANTKAKASEVNANFTAVKTAVDDNAHMTGIAIETLAASGEISRDNTNNDIYSLTINAPADGYMHVLATGTIEVQKLNTNDSILSVSLASQTDYMNGYTLRLNSDYGGYYSSQYALQGVLSVTKGIHTYTISALDIGSDVLLNKTITNNTLTAIFYKNNIKN